MGTYAGPFSGKDKRALTRADVEERIRYAGDSRQVDLTGEDLSKANLSNMKLIGIKFKLVNLSGADLSGADLTEANLSGADLRRAYLDGAYLTGVDLGEANLSNAYLSGADLRRAYLSGAYLSGAYLSGADLSDADLSDADLSDANLSNANLSNANLRRADLTGAHFTGADLSGARLTGVHLARTSIGDRAKTSSPQISTEITDLGLFLHITETPLTLQHLTDILNTVLRLYVKLWLLDQQRFEDFTRYSTEGDRSLEAEITLPITEMTYNSPLKAKINIDLSPKGVVEALQTLIETIAFFQLRREAAKAELLSNQLNNQIKQEELKQTRLTTIEHAFGTLEQGNMLLGKLSPGLSEEQKMFALQSLAKEVLHLASDATFDITLIPPLSTEKQKVAETPVSIQAAEALSDASTSSAERQTK